uniref:Large ribosomal subunit protein P2 n=1 Tax=Macrostomum lignano TaxID=282301 RepID=A0A1I8F2I1_9PLAT
YTALAANHALHRRLPAVRNERPGAHQGVREENPRLSRHRLRRGRLNKLFADLKGKSIDEMIEAGQKKLASVPSGAPAAGAAAAAPAAAAEAAKPEARKRRKKRSPSQRMTTWDSACLTENRTIAAFLECFFELIARTEGPTMRYIAAFLLSAMSGQEPTKESVKKILGSVGIDCERGPAEQTSIDEMIRGRSEETRQRPVWRAAAVRPPLHPPRPPEAAKPEAKERGEEKRSPSQRMTTWDSLFD